MTIAWGGENEKFSIRRMGLKKNVIMKSHEKYDALTGLYSRSHFNQYAKTFNSSNQSLGLIVCDIDGLKSINDSYGNVVGDQLLIHFSQIIRSCVQSSEPVFRLGSDEFAAFVNVTFEEELIDFSAQLQVKAQALNQYYPNIPITVSIGYASSAHVNLSLEALFKKAEDHMYKEKVLKMQSTRSSVFMVLMQALGARDVITEDHSERLQDLIYKFAKKIGVKEQQMPEFKLLAHLHDIGKIGIPDSILHKSSSLNEEEWKIMKTHSEIGYKIVFSIPELVPISNWVRLHHEWWNGGGYPLGLKQEEIPIACRALSIVDAFDAMTNDRPYRNKMSVENAIAELRRCAGSQFDPNLVEYFIEVISNDQKFL